MWLETGNVCPRSKPTYTTSYSPTGNRSQKALQSPLLLHADNRSPCATHTGVRDISGALRQDPGVRGAHVGMGADHSANAAVQVMAHGHLLAGGLRVEVHKHVAHSMQLRQRLLHRFKGATRRLHVEETGEGDHSQPSGLRIHHHQSSPGGRGKVVIGTEENRSLVNIRVDLSTLPNMIAGGDYIRPSPEHLVRQTGKRLAVQ